MTTRNKDGFALIIALSLMAFVTLLLLTISTLVRVESSATNQSKSLQLAQQNSLLGLQEALGELQATAGPDQRITATGSLWQTPKPGTEHLVGVWNSEDTNGDGIADGNFQRWLVSRSNTAEVEDISFVTNPVAIPIDKNTYTSTANDHIVLVGGGSTTQDPDNPNTIQGVVAQKKPIRSKNNQANGIFDK